MGRDLLGGPGWLVAGLTLLAAGSAEAQSYVCTTPDGRTIMADRQPPECADRPTRELRPDGSVRRVIEPPLTAEQRAKRDAERKRQIEAEERALQQRRSDRALLESYVNEKEIEAERRRILADRQALIDQSSRRLDELARERKRLENEAEFYARRKLPDWLARAFERNEQSARLQERLIDDLRAEMQRVGDQYDERRRRYRELTARPRAPQSRAQHAHFVVGAGNDGAVAAPDAR
jgi:hypothetical protein